MAPIFMLLAQLIPSIVKYATADGSTVEKITGVAAEIARTVSGKSDTTEAINAIKADPQLYADFQLKIKEQEMAWDKMYIDDIANARARDIALAQSGQGNKRANYIAAFAFLLLLACLIVSVWMTELNEYAKGVVTFIAGRASGWVEQIFSFEFGTTRANKTKDDTINKLSGS